MSRLSRRTFLAVPFGQWVVPTAHRKTVSGVLEFAAPLFWNVSLG
jgi:hypothetical protein